MMHSQNNEYEIIRKVFCSSASICNFKGNLLSIGENDGITFSNSRNLIIDGWSAHLIEPATIPFEKLSYLYANSPNVKCHNIGITDRTETAILYESGAHVPGGDDVGLVSTFSVQELRRWDNVNFVPNEVQCLAWEAFYASISKPKFDFISIDCEGSDLRILEQMDLTEIGCKCLCIEWNSHQPLADVYIRICVAYGLKEIARNAENIIFAL